MAKKVMQIPYGKRVLTVGVEEDNLVYVLRPAEVMVSEDIAADLEEVLQHPTGSLPLEQIVKKGDKVALLADDITRLTPARFILPRVLDHLNRAGVPDEDILLVIALGTHRPMTEWEILEKYGKEVKERIRIINHNCLDEKNLLPYGTTRRGTGIWINRFVMEADKKIGIGNIVPHHPTGWSGGAKILLPGVAGEKTTGQFHLLGATEQLLGHIDTPCREEMEDFAAAVGFDFIINTVLDRNGRVVKFVAGDIVRAHREGVKWGQKVFGAPFPRESDITVSSTYPVDYDLFQADKGMFSAAISTKKGGEIILLSPCYEGVSPTHPEAVALAGLSDDELFRLARSPGREHDPLSIAEVLYLNSVKKDFRVILTCEGIDEKTVREMGFLYLKPEHLQRYLDQKATEGKTIGIIHNSAETLPVHTSNR